jgi:DNA-binding transcriptional MerR regulator
MKDVVDLTGIPATTLRFYDKKGLLQFVRRSVGGVRIFTDRDIALLRLIQFFRNVDMSIQEISLFISLYLQGPATRPQREELLRSHVAQLKEDVKSKEEKLSAASFMNDLLTDRLKAGETENDLPLTILKKDIPEEMRKFFTRNEKK